MRPRNAGLACLLALSAAASTPLDHQAVRQTATGNDPRPAAVANRESGTAAGNDSLESISAEDAKVLRALLGVLFPTWPAQVLVLEKTVSVAALDPKAAAGRDSQLSLRGTDLGPNVTLVTRENAPDALARSAISTVMIEFTRPAYTTDRQSATVRYKVTRHTDKGSRWLTGILTLSLKKERWVLAGRQDSGETQDSGDADLPLRAGGDVRPPVLVTRVEAEATPEAVQNRISGVVILEIVVDKTGHVTDARVLKPLPFGLNAAAIAAVKQWEYLPATLNGEAVTVLYNVVVSFTAK